eukprot:scaffold107079_cov72-Phaeocystis_antarctica.AAC.5
MVEREQQHLWRRRLAGVRGTLRSNGCIHPEVVVGACEEGAGGNGKATAIEREASTYARAVPGRKRDSVLKLAASAHVEGSHVGAEDRRWHDQHVAESPGGRPHAGCGRPVSCHDAPIAKGELPAEGLVLRQARCAPLRPPNLVWCRISRLHPPAGEPGVTCAELERTLGDLKAGGRVPNHQLRHALGRRSLLIVIAIVVVIVAVLLCLGDEQHTGAPGCSLHRSGRDGELALALAEVPDLELVVNLAEKLVLLDLERVHRADAERARRVARVGQRVDAHAVCSAHRKPHVADGHGFNSKPGNLDHVLHVRRARVSRRLHALFIATRASRSQDVSSTARVSSGRSTPPTENGGSTDGVAASIDCSSPPPGMGKTPTAMCRMACSRAPGSCSILLMSDIAIAHESRTVCVCASVRSSVCVRARPVVPCPPTREFVETEDEPRSQLAGSGRLQKFSWGAKNVAVNVTWLP